MRQNRRKVWIIATAIVMAVVLGLFCAGSYFERQVKGFVVEKLTETVQNELGRLYKLTINDLRFSLRPFTTLSVAGDFSILPDSAAMKSMQADSTMPHTVFALHSGRFEITIKRGKRNFKNKHLEISRLEIDNPRFEIMRDSTTGDPRALRDTAARKPLPLHSLTVRQIDIRNGFFTYTHLRQADTVRHRLAKIDLRVEKLALDSTFKIKALRLPPIDSFRCRIENSEHSPAGEAYALNIRRIDLDLATRSVTLDSVRLIPRYAKEEFAAVTPAHRDWMELEAPRIELAGLDIGRLLRRDAFTADSIMIRDARFATYKNRKVHVPNKVKPLFHQSLQRAGIPIEVGLVRIVNGAATYEELPLKGYVAGRLTVEAIDARIDSLTNIPSSDRDYFTLNGQMRMMGSGLLTVHMQFPIEAENDHFILRGTLGPMPMEPFNAMAEPLGHIGLRSGRIGKIEFTMEGDSVAGVIDMRFRYDSLQVDVLNKMGLRSWVGSTLVNRFVVLESNPMKNKKFRQVHTTARRDPYKSNFNYLWRISFEGIKESAGLTLKKQGEFSRLQQKLHEMKLHREQRRQEREQKHEEPEEQR